MTEVFHKLKSGSAVICKLPLFDLPPAAQKTHLLKWRMSFGPAVKPHNLTQPELLYLHHAFLSTRRPTIFESSDSPLPLPPQPVSLHLSTKVHPFLSLLLKAHPHAGFLPLITEATGYPCIPPLSFHSVQNIQGTCYAEACTLFPR